MKSKKAILIALFFQIILIWVSISCEKEVSKSKLSFDILVNTNIVLIDGVSTKFGININAGIDNDVNRSADARPIHEALDEMGIKHLRYPGGNKSNYFSWSASPYTDANTCFWVPGWYKDNARISLNFDEFMSICRQVGAIPHINVAYNPGGGLGSELAAEWVKYANITKGYGVKYWEIGNEMWKKDLNFTTESLASLVITYSAAMKAIDPSIKIGVSWKNYQAIVTACESSLDYVTMSDYSGDKFKIYANYASGENMELTYTTASSTKKVIASEYAPLIFGSEGDNNNDTGRGLITFDQTGQILLNKNCEYACFWNTRWYSEDGRLSDVLDPLNNLRASGKALSIWGKFLRDKMVSSESQNASIISYASYDDSNGDLNVFIINKKLTAQTIGVGITSENKYNNTFDVWQYKGTSNFDKNPVFAKTGTVGFADNNAEKIVLPATSVTAILIKK